MIGDTVGIDLTNPQHRQDLADQIKLDIDDFCSTFYEQGHRKHLGASEMGKECWRQLYYKFRWVKLEKHEGRIMRLFNVGHSAEPRFISYLRGIGFEVNEFAEDGKQFRISGANGHYGGSLDGQCIPPAHYNIVGNLVLLNEYKTNGTGAGYNHVATQALAKAKPEHWAQVCQYGAHYQIKYCLYMIENKNDSDITIRIEELDWNYGKQLERKAEEIINSKTPLPRISDNPSFQACKWCTFSDICHNGAKVEVNCRSCREASPIEDGKWFCHKFSMPIPDDFIAQGCSEHVGI